MIFRRALVNRLYWSASLVLAAVALTAALTTPVDPAQGSIQRILYLHLPVAINALGGSLVVFIACVAYLGGGGAWHRQWDKLAQSAAKMTVINASVLLLTGVIWAKIAWQHWWVWSPRLVFSLLLWLLYVGYLALKPVFGPGARGATIAAVYGTVAFLDVPLLYLSVNLLPDIHPSHINLSSQAGVVLSLWLLTVSMVSGGLIAVDFALSCERLRHEEPVSGKPASVDPRGRAI